MPAGKVRLFNDAKGFGFIERDDGTGDIFVQVNNCTVDGLVKGQRVRFDERADQRSGKPEAVNVVLVGNCLYPARYPSRDNKSARGK